MAEVARSSYRYAGYVPAVIRTYIGVWDAARQAALYIDPYLRGEHPLPIASNSQTQAEQYELRKIAGTPYGRMILKSSTQALRVKGLRVPGERETPEIWDKLWTRNKMKARQNGITRSAVGYGVGYSLLLPGELGITREPGIEIRNFTPKTMTAVYAEDHNEWPTLALNGERQVDSTGEIYYMFTVIDDEAVHFAVVYDLSPMSPDQMKITYLESRPHPSDVTPVVRHSPLLDDDGGSRGEILPFLPILKRIDQTLYDRLLIQRQAAWKVRWATGIKKPAARSDQERMQAMLKAGDVLTSEEVGSKFGTMDESSMAEHNQVHESDLRDLAAASQTPSYMVTGQSDNIGAEALSAITSGYHQKIEEWKDSLAVGNEQMFELAAHMDPSLGTYQEGFEIRWQEFRPYSLTQVSDALGKLAQQLEIPPDQLFEYVPFFSSDDVERAIEGREEAKDEALALAQTEAAQAQAGTPAQRRSRGSAADSNQNPR